MSANTKRYKNETNKLTNRASMFIYKYNVIVYLYLTRTDCLQRKKKTLYIALFRICLCDYDIKSVLFT